MKPAVALAALALAACTDSIAAGGSGLDAGPQDDPLVFSDDEPAAGTLAHIHRTIIQPSCAGQPGLCHAGQFEPNMATPASFYAALVNRPGLEHPTQLRVQPGAPGDSLLVDKLRGRNVGTQMPLGAEPLSNGAIAEIEQWIEDGALRQPGAEPAPVLNELPADPEIGLYSASGVRLDGAGPVQVSPGQTITIRQSVEDFETPDAQIPAAVFVIAFGNGQNVVVNPGATDPHVAHASFDPLAPTGRGDLLDWKFDWTVPATASVRDDATGAITPGVAMSGRTLSIIALYVDQIGPEGMSSLAIQFNALEVE